jgi:hypothetical protein
MTIRKKQKKLTKKKSYIFTTFMPHSRSPSEAEVLAAHLAICRVRFSADASSPCCLVPIFKSSTHGRSNLDADATFSSIMKTNKSKRNEKKKRNESNG